MSLGCTIRWLTLYPVYRFSDSASWLHSTCKQSNCHSIDTTTSKLADIVSNLLQSSLRPSSIPMYRRAWGLYTQFSYLTFGVANIRLPLSVSNIALFIAYLYHRDYAASTATSYVSALGYIHRLANVSDPTKQFFILEMLKGYGKTVTRLDTRLPITLPILRQFLQVSPSICTSQYVCCLFKAMCTVVFFAFLRIGEMTTSSGSSEVLQLHHLERVTNSSGDVVSITIKFLNIAIISTQSLLY